MGSMKAVTVNSFESGPSIQEIPAPETAGNQVLVRVHAASINAFDSFIAIGAAKGMIDHTFPVTIGVDFAGVVESVGPDASRFAPGDEVFGAIQTGAALHDGSFAEFAAVSEEYGLALKPAEIGFPVAASLPVAGLTALAAIDAIDPSADDPVLIVGATGGVGSFAVQMAARRGARVIATGLKGDVGYLRDLGATEIVDYTKDVAEQIRTRYPDGIRGLVDAVNFADGFAGLADLLGPGGVATSTKGAADGGRVTATGASAVNVGGSFEPALLERMAGLVASGEIRVPLQRVYPFDEAPGALDAFRNEHTLGKLVISVVPA